MSLHGKIAIHVTGSKKRIFFENDLSPGCLLQMFLLKKEHMLHHPSFLTAPPEAEGELISLFAKASWADLPETPGHQTLRY